MPLDGVAFSQLVDYNEITFSIESVSDGVAHIRDFGVRKLWQVGIFLYKKMGRFAVNKSGTVILLFF